MITARTLQFAAIAILVGAIASPGAARGDTFNVTKTADTADGACNADCSLREAVNAANAHAGLDDVIVPAGVYVLTRTGPGDTGDVDVNGDLHLTGAGAEATILDGNG
jgi:CSLREA domain-containing protein